MTSVRSGDFFGWPYSYVVFVPFKDGRPSGPPTDVLAGFVDSEGAAKGRPVGVAVDGRGALFVADDVGDVVWRASSAKQSVAIRRH